MNQCPVAVVHVPGAAAIMYVRRTDRTHRDWTMAEWEIDLARGVQGEAVNGLRVGILWTSMGCIIESALRQVPKPPKPVLDHFPHNRGILGRPDAA